MPNGAVWPLAHGRRRATLGACTCGTTCTSTTRRTASERHYLVRVGFSAPAVRISKEVELAVGAPRVVGQWLEVRVTWRATGPGGLFPVMDGKLTVQRLGPRSSTLWFGGTYEPPLGALGREIDGVVMHNVADATIKDFVESAAARLSELAANRPA